MNGIHDLGGRDGFGRVPHDAGDDETGPFRAEWEGRVFALAALTSARGCFSADAFRHAIERLDPVTYLTAGYYGRWLGALESLVDELGVDLAPGRLASPGAAAREVAAPPRYGVGDRVRTRNLQPRGHTRLPAYARGRCGIVTRLQGGWVFPDTNAHDAGENPQHVYAVRFEGRELWGDSAEPGTCVHLDCFESYLEPA